MFPLLTALLALGLEVFPFASCSVFLDQPLMPLKDLVVEFHSICGHFLEPQYDLFETYDFKGPAEETLNKCIAINRRILKRIPATPRAQRKGIHLSTHRKYRKSLYELFHTWGFEFTRVESESNLLWWESVLKAIIENLYLDKCFSTRILADKKPRAVPGVHDEAGYEAEVEAE